MDKLMSLNTLEREILDGVSEARDEAALEAVRVSALGKKGAISERMKTLGTMSPVERKEAGAELNLLKDRVTEAIARRRTELKERALEDRLQVEKLDVTLPIRPERQGTIHP